MTIYKKNLLAWAVVMTSGLSSGIAALYLSNWFFVPFITIAYSAHLFFNRITCPSCGEPATFVSGRGPEAGLRILSGIFQKKCQNCGADMDKDS